MWEELLRAVPVFLSSMLKFIFGPTGGYAIGLHPITTIAATVGGTMASVIAFTYFGKWLRSKLLDRWGGKKKLFTTNNRRIVKIWRKYGLFGVATLMPLLLTPIGGTAVAVSFGSPKNRIILYMFLSALLWATVFTLLIYEFGRTVLPGFVNT